eukprot:132526_1
MATKNENPVLCLDDVKTEFITQIGHEPKTVQQMLSFCQQNGFGFRYKEINEWWHNTSNCSANASGPHYNTDTNRESWTLNTWLMAFSRSKNEWYPCQVVQCIGEHLLVIKYNKTTKTIQRNAKNIGPFPSNHPLLFKKGTKCKIYCRKILKWCDAQILNIFTDHEGEWLHVKYNQNGLHKICDIQRFSKDLIAHHDLDGVWNEEIESIESCDVDNIIYILRNSILTKPQFQTNKFTKYTEKIVAYFYRNKINGQRIIQLDDQRFAEQLLCELEIKNGKKLRNAFIKIFNLFAVEIDRMIPKKVETIKSVETIKEAEEKRKNDEVTVCISTHHFSQRRFFVSW